MYQTLRQYSPGQTQVRKKQETMSNSNRSKTDDTMFVLVPYTHNHVTSSSVSATPKRVTLRANRTLVPPSAVVPPRSLNRHYACAERHHNQAAHARFAPYVRITLCLASCWSSLTQNFCIKPCGKPMIS